MLDPLEGDANFPAEILIDLGDRIRRPEGLGMPGDILIERGENFERGKRLLNSDGLREDGEVVFLKVGES